MSDARRPHRVTVVLLTYNCAHRLARVLDRLCELDAPILAVDNASTDNTVAKLRERPGIEVITLPLNTGAAGRNIGVQHARTPYVAFCDDDSWWEEGSLDLAANAMDACPKIALINARITVGPEGELDPISAEMEATPLPPVAGAPGLAVMGFMAGAVVVRVSAYRDVGGYQPRFFMGGEEETLAFPLLRGGWLLRYLPEVTSHHEPSLTNAPWLRAHGMRNTLWNAWEHRRF